MVFLHHFTPLRSTILHYPPPSCQIGAKRAIFLGKFSAEKAEVVLKREKWPIGPRKGLESLIL
jgi:hypothetical protein